MTIEEMMGFVLENYGYLIKEINGKKYVYREAIDELKLSPQEKAFVNLTFTTYDVLVIESSKKEEVTKPNPDEITKENRSGRVRDFDYGKIRSNGQQALDKPVISKIFFEGEQIVFEDNKELEEFLLHDFIPSKVLMKKNRSVNAKTFKLNGEDFSKPYPSIQLNEITKLRLSEKETEYVCQFLEKNGIRIGGTSPDMDAEFSNYDYVRTYATTKYPKPLTREEQQRKFEKYYETKDPELKKELIERNLRLVPYVAWRLALIHGVDQDELESYGYEALSLLVEKYNPHLISGYDSDHPNERIKFSTYAIPRITGFMKNAIPKMKKIPRKLYYDFQNVRYIVEKEWCQKYDGNPEMLDEILEVMIAQGMVSRKQKQDLRVIFGVPLSIDEILENGQEIADEYAYANIDVTVFNAKLHDVILELIETLNPKEEKVLINRYGLLDGHQRTLKEVADDMYVSTGRVYQIETKALRKLRHPSRSKFIRGFSDENRNEDKYIVDGEDPSIQRHR